MSDRVSQAALSFSTSSSALQRVGGRLPTLLSVTSSMAVAHALAVVRKDLDDAAIGNPTVGAFGQHPLEFDLQGREADDPLLGAPQVLPRERVGGGARLTRVVLQGDELQGRPLTDLVIASMRRPFGR